MVRGMESPTASAAFTSMTTDCGIGSVTVTWACREITHKKARQHSIPFFNWNSFLCGTYVRRLPQNRTAPGKSWRMHAPPDPHGAQSLLFGSVTGTSADPNPLEIAESTAGFSFAFCS